MAENLGEVQLLVTVNADNARLALQQFQAQVSQSFGSLNIDKGIQAAFNLIEREAAATGARAGRALSEGLQKEVKAPKFANLKEAFTFHPERTINGLKAYKKALDELAGTLKLNSQDLRRVQERSQAVGVAIKEAGDSTLSYAQAQRSLEAGLKAVRAARKAAEDKQAATDAKANAAADREWAAAIRDLETAQRGAARAARETNDAYKQQLQTVLSLGQATVKTGSNLAAGAVKGIGRAVSDSIKVGKAGYNLGAEFGIFEAPKTGPIKEAIKEVSDRFKFIGEQAATTRGQILRLVEGLGSAAGLQALVEQADLLRSSLQNISSASQAANTSLNALEKFGGRLSEVWNNAGWLTDNGQTLIGRLLQFGHTTEAAAAGVSNLQNAFTQFGAGAIDTVLSGLQSLQGALGAIPPEAQAVVLALAGITAAPILNKTAGEGLAKLSLDLEGLSATAIQAREDLQRVLNKELQSSGLTPDEQAQKRNNAERLRVLRLETEERKRIAKELDLSAKPQLALPSADLLANRVRASGQGQPQRLSTSGFNTDLEAQSRVLGEQLDEQETLRRVEKERKQGQVELNAALEVGLKLMRATVDVLERQKKLQNKFNQPPLPPEGSLQRDDIRRRLREKYDTGFGAFSRRATQLQEELNAPFIDPRRAARERLARIQALRSKRQGNIVSSALIGGAFPLLFGQGIGASIGGGLGGGIGGRMGGQFGFGASLVGTAIGTAFDNALTKFRELGDALSNPIANFNSLKEAALLSSKAVEKQVAALIESGRGAEAYATIVEDLTTKFGSLERAKALSDAQDQLNRGLASLSTRMAELLSGPVTAFIRVLNTALGGAGTGKPEQVTDNGAFRAQVDKIAEEYGRQEGAKIIRRQASLQSQFISKNFLSSFLNKATFGAFGEDAGAVANKQALDEASAAGKLTKEQRNNNSLKAEAVKLQEQSLAIARALVTAQVQDNQVATVALQLAKSRVAERQALLELPPEERAGVKGQKIQTDAAAERAALAEAAKERARASGVDLANTQINVRLSDEALQIAQQRQKVAEAIRVEEQAIGAAQAAASNASLRSDDRLAIENELLAAVNKRAQVELEAKRSIAALEAQQFARQIAHQEAMRSLATREGIAQERINGLGTAGAGALDLISNFRAALARESEAQALLRGTPDSAQLRNAAQQAAEEVKAAAVETKANLLDAYKSAERSVKQISRSIAEGVSALNQAQGGESGVNKYISAQDRYGRQSSANGALRQEAADLAARLGVEFRFASAPTSLGDSNSQLSEFINAARSEINSIEDIGLAQQDLAIATKDLKAAESALAEINQELANNTLKLAEKDWNIYIATQNSDGSIRQEVYQ